MKVLFASRFRKVELMQEIQLKTEINRLIGRRTAGPNGIPSDHVPAYVLGKLLLVFTTAGKGIGFPETDATLP